MQFGRTSNASDVRSIGYSELAQYGILTVPHLREVSTLCCVYRDTTTILQTNVVQ